MAEKDGLRKLIPFNQLVSSNTEVGSQRVDMEAVAVSQSELEISKTIVECFREYRRNHPNEAARENCPSPVDLICDSLIKNRGLEPIGLTVEQSRVSQPGLVLASALDTEETRVNAQSIVLVRPVAAQQSSLKMVTAANKQNSQIVPAETAVPTPFTKPVNRQFFLRAVYQQGLPAYQLEGDLDEGQLDQPASSEPQSPTDPEFKAQQQASFALFIDNKAA